MVKKTLMCNFNGKFVDLNAVDDHFDCIYMMRNITNDKIYIGKAVSLQRRMREHQRNALETGKDDCPILNNAIRKNGWDLFDISVLIEDVCDNNTLMMYEKMFVELYNCVNAGYNIQEGGQGGYSYTHPLTYSVSKYKNPKQYRRERYLRHGHKWNAHNKIRYYGDVERFRQKSRDYRKSHKYEIDEKRRNRYKFDLEYRHKNDERSKKYAENHKEELKKYHSDYYKEHCEEIKEKSKERYYKNEYDGKGYVRKAFAEINKGKKEGYWIEEGEKMYIGKTRLRVMRRTISFEERDIKWIFVNYENILNGGIGVSYASVK